jgi:hypothetical protein
MQKSSLLPPTFKEDKLCLQVIDAVHISNYMTEGTQMAQMAQILFFYPFKSVSSVPSVSLLLP